jgi:hypothetical protein
MKKLILLVVIGVLLFSSCEKKSRESVSVWNSQEVTLNSLEYPVSVVWFKESAKDLWIPYKGFNTASEIKNIINLLDAPEIKFPQPELRTRNKLSLIYYLGEPAFLSVIEVYFDVNDGVVEEPRGKSRELGKILLEKQESGLARYRPFTPPYNEEFINRVEKSEEELRKEIKKLKAQRELEGQGQTTDTNIAE